ncbi:hypothetical protein D3C85_1403630 [compost metagenome]
MQQDAVRVDPGPSMAMNVGHADEVAPGDDRLDPLVHAEGQRLEAPNLAEDRSIYAMLQAVRG